MRSKQRGILMIELIVFLVVIVVIGSITVPRLADRARTIHTKQELKTIASVIQLYEIDEGQLPRRLNDLDPYFQDDGYKTDGWNNPYEYDRMFRTISSNQGYSEQF